MEQCELITVCLSFSFSISFSLSLQYRFYGEQMVKACVENGAHHIDISGEPQVFIALYCNVRVYLFIFALLFILTQIMHLTR